MMCLLVLQTALAPWFLSGSFYTFTHLALAERGCKGAVRNYQGGRVTNNRGRVMISCALKKGGLQFFQLSLRGGS